MKRTPFKIQLEIHLRFDPVQWDALISALRELEIKIRKGASK